MKSTVSNILIIGGMLALPTGAWMLAPGLGVVALSVVLLALGWLVDPPNGRGS